MNEFQTVVVVLVGGCTAFGLGSLALFAWIWYLAAKNAEKSGE